MNIIKFKDIIVDSESNLSENDIQFFNNKLKGKYAYAINWKYIVDLDSINFDEYLKISNGDPIYVPYIDIQYVYDFVDFEETNNINNIDKLKTFNRYTTDSSITIDELKKFRPWLAFMLLQQNINDDKINHVLQYYSFDDMGTQTGAGMYDEVIKQLSNFGKVDVSLTNITSTCGCVNSSNTIGSIKQTNVVTTNKKSYCDCVTLSNQSSYNSVSICDTIEIYRKNIYIKMVETFKEIDFWTPYKDTILIDMVNYIKNIINVNLPLHTSKYISNYVECGCLSNKEMEQNTNIQILKNLEQSLNYIINDDITGHKNFISDSLYSWSSLLYEKMYWE